MKVPIDSEKFAREALRKGFVKAVAGCDIQDGWPCRTCFFFTLAMLGIKGDEAHAFWLVQLRLRNKPGFEPGYTITTTPTPEQAAHEARAREFREQRATPRMTSDVIDLSDLPPGGTRE